MSLEMLLVNNRIKKSLTEVFVTSYVHVGNGGLYQYAYDVDDFKRNINLPAGNGVTAYCKVNNFFVSLALIGTGGGVSFTVYHTPTNTIIPTPTINYYRVKSMIFSNDGSKLAVIGYVVSGGELSLKIYNVNDWSPVNHPPLTIVNNSSANYDITYSPDDRYLVVGCNMSPYLFIFNTLNWVNVSLSNVPNTVYNVCFSPTGEYLAVCSYYSPGVTFYNVNTWEKINGLPNISGNPESLCWSPDEQFVYISNRTSPYLRKYSFPTMTMVKQADVAQKTNARKLVITQDGGLIGGSEGGIYDSDLNLVFTYPEYGSTNNYCILAEIQK